MQTLERAFQAVVDASESSNADDEHDPEGATIAFERSQLAAQLALARAGVAEVDEALRPGRAGHVRRVHRLRWDDPGRPPGGAARRRHLRRLRPAGLTAP